jgi:hypothetical protein
LHGAGPESQKPAHRTHEVGEAEQRNEAADEDQERLCRDPRRKQGAERGGEDAADTALRFRKDGKAAAAP